MDDRTGTSGPAPARRMRRVLRAAGRALALPGFWFATGCAFAWGKLLGGRYERRNGVRVIHGLPKWAFGRGGTTIGAIYLTRDAVGDRVLEHEAVHVEQWRRYGLLLIPLYLAAGLDPMRNRFEIEAGLEKGGYLRRRS